MPHYSSSTLDFLTQLKANNNKEWFDANRKAYESAKAEHLAVAQGLLTELSRMDPEYAEVEAKSSVFRINRDVRFSNDKSPYKTNIGMALNPGGKKAARPTFYLHVEPGQCFIAGGLYLPEPKLLAKIRQEIDYNWADFSAIIHKPSFVSRFQSLSTEHTLAKPPKGYTADNPAMDILKLKSFVVSRKVADKELLQANLIESLMQDYAELRPLNKFLDEIFLDA